MYPVDTSHIVTRLPQTAVTFTGGPGSTGKGRLDDLTASLTDLSRKRRTWDHLPRAPRPQNLSWLLDHSTPSGAARTLPREFKPKLLSSRFRYGFHHQSLFEVALDPPDIISFLDTRVTQRTREHGGRCVQSDNCDSTFGHV